MLLERYGIAPLKQYGQNFLIDGNIAEKIAAAAVPKGTCALEIGPGLGALTQRLAGRAGSVAAYEIDAGLFGVLRDLFADRKNVALFHNDFLKANIMRDLQPIFKASDIYVAANLPYYITSPCIMKLLETELNIKSITVMVQKEVAQRICAPPGSRDYGAISAAVAFFAQPEMLFTVSPACFYPKPKVTSAVLRLTVGSGRQNAKSYLATVKGAFRQPKKNAQKQSAATL